MSAQLDATVSALSGGELTESSGYLDRLLLGDLLVACPAHAVAAAAEHCAGHHADQRGGHPAHSGDGDPPVQ
ncbi:hypothetical protein OG828_48725 [Streptomyces sp. NBC_00457]|uniref:hypothetical protein n=1 Tax=Streptomyces sp. NBC_00457 TaxID=2975748 RepID=UPI002E1A5EF7